MTAGAIVRRTFVLLVAFLATYALFFFSFAALTLASSGEWLKGANIEPVSTTNFSSDNFKQSLQNLKATGANYVALVVPYYQSNTGSTDLNPGWNTPDDSSLTSAIDYAH